MDIKSLVNEFDNLRILRTLIDCIDLNYLQRGDLEEIAGHAEELNINCININDIYTDRFTLDILNEWIEKLESKHLDIKNKIIKEVNNDKF